MLEKLPDAIGHALRNQRAGMEKLAFHQIDLRAGTAALRVQSQAFADHAPLPARYTADGRGISPPLQWTGVPAGAASVVVMAEDADAPTLQPLVHMLVVELPGADGALAEGALESPDHDNTGYKTGLNSFFQASWLPPDPPPGHGTHRYAFQVFALAAGPAFSDVPGREQVLEALRERAIASGCLIGTYERPDGAVKLPLGTSASLTPA